MNANQPAPDHPRTLAVERYRTSSNTVRCAGCPTQALGLLTWTSGEPRNESTEVTMHAE
jgi:hypothetical protein